MSSKPRTPRQLLHTLMGRQPASSADTVAARFLQVFREHGVEASQIPRLLPQIKLDDLQSSSKLLAALTPEILDKAAQFFGVRVQWLEGVDEEIYDYLATYKQPTLLLERLTSICTNLTERPSFPLRVLVTRRNLNWRDGNVQQLAPVLVERIAIFGEEEICRYHIFRDGFDWSHTPARTELKAITRVIYDALHMPAPLFVISSKQMDNILEGRLIPRRFLSGCQLTNPSLEDYVLSREESSVAKESEELPTVLSYIEQHGLQGFSFAPKPAATPSVEPSESPTATAPTETPNPPKKPGKRQALAVAWGQARIYAKARWAEDRTISIEDMVRRIKSNKALMTSEYSESAIRKHIADLAPPGVRGKSGRKPKKST